ncbi:hypothetical protein GP486_007089 [Trichoglossum hirsutum]|uniref:Uncharacterized protein n=1 Tax=Trichoglossum hirsutum TaxID=265104 RepID=A0A9P8IJQ4_9PEZI|nr:hypothetical protein GP486_007089 [Trichoglossum hirsutum]
MGNKHSTSQDSSFDAFPDVGFSPVTLRPDFPDGEQADFVAALQAYYINQNATAATAVEEALRSQPSVARTSWRLLDRLVRRHDGQLWSEGIAKRTSWAELHTEEIVVRVAEAARETLTVAAVAGLEAKTDGAQFARRRGRAEYLGRGLAELLGRVPMPPSAGAVVTDIEIFGRILYHHIMNNKPPVQSSMLKVLERDEGSAFRALCDYLLAERRLDLLTQAVEFRAVTEQSELTYVCKTLEAAFPASASKYQAAKCKFLHLQLSRKLSRSQRKLCANLSPIFDLSGDKASSVRVQLMVMDGTPVEDELRQLQALRDRTRSAQHYESMRDLCQREVKLWLKLDTRQRFEGLVHSLHDLELAEARQDCIDGLPSRHENFLSFLSSALSALGNSESIAPKKMVACVYMEDVCREGRLPRFTAWWAALALNGVYQHLWKYDYYRAATGTLASKQAFVSLLLVKAARAIHEGKVPSGDDSYFDAKLSTSWARSYVTHLMEMAYHSPEPAARRILLRAQEVSRHHMSIALARGWTKLAYHMAVRGARASIRLRQNLYKTEFWPQVKKFGGREEFLEGDIGKPPLDQRTVLPAEYTAISKNPSAYWRGSELARSPKIEALESWYLQVESAVRKIRGSKSRGPWWDDIGEILS